MPRPFTRAQALENARFLEMLAETGNARLAARAVRRAHATMHERRGKCAGFALRWDAALVMADARLHRAGGKAAAVAEAAPPPRFARSPSPAKAGADLRTQGGEPVVVRTRGGRLQIRPAHKGKLTKKCEQAFFAALAATANIRLSAAATGASARAFYRRREKNRAFAREMRLALRTGYERIEAAALMAGLPESYADDAWRHNDPLPIPAMTPSQALQLLCLHDKSVYQGWEKPHRRKRRGESEETYTERLRAMWMVEERHKAEDEAVARAARAEADERGAGQSGGVPVLPALDQVTGWSRAQGKPPHDAELALFGGWRIEHMEKSRGA
ncbi:hypothetical protein [Sphingosinicella sp. LY1275]|uniref:hypothetical protein n=1 Tax=Sphingosinicella sp. LY1275 TaxID=3095379 RepID=UPI002ADEEF04|nr:hypothetical protein [Sphingosinicella sp. LY1275]MEA1015988.1 hypothetical protein [Sphingosinicella sp. LY1275]